MKRKLVASILGIAACVASSYGQGTVLFDNYANTAFGTQVTVDGTITSDTTIVIGLWVGANAGSLSLLSTTPIFWNTTYGGGWYSGGNPTIPSTLFTGSQTVTFQVRGSGGIGAFAQGVTGSSATWTESPAPTGSLVLVGNPANEMMNGPAALLLTSINNIPEPTTFALLGLGAAGLMFFRRKQ
jgi:hypothetical protein